VQIAAGAYPVPAQMTFQSGSFVDDPQNSVWLYSYQIASAAAAPGISGQWPPGFLPIGLQDLTIVGNKFIARRSGSE
jgi:hypothetical protein